MRVFSGQHSYRGAQLFGYGVRSLSDNNYNYTIFEKKGGFMKTKVKVCGKKKITFRIVLSLVKTNKNPKNQDYVSILKVFSSQSTYFLLYFISVV